MEINQYKGIIQILNQLGYNILLIDDTFYAVDEFFHAENNITKHIVVGRDITKLISDNSISAQRQTFDTHKQIFQTTIDKIFIEKREYSHLYKWINFLG